MEPNPAVAVNVRWDVLASNRAMRMFLGGLPGELTRTPLNMLRATLHPDGFARQVVNLGQWRVGRQLRRTGADGLSELLSELEGYGVPDCLADPLGQADHELVVPLQLAMPQGQLALLYAVTVFGSARHVTLDEIAIETFFPADPSTAQTLRSLADLPA